MTEYRWAQPSDYQNIIDEANHAFDTAHYTGDFEKDTGKDSFFPRILPKLYQNPRIAPMHVLALEDGKICGLVGLFDLPYVVHGTPLKVKGIGTVSVRPGYRGKGYMKELMAMAVRRAEEEQADYMVLGGRRQRYGHWGFEQAGAMPSYKVMKHNLHYVYGEDADFGYRFRKLLPEDADAIREERKLREAAQVHMVYPENEEYAVLCSMGTVPYLIEKDQQFAGTFLYEENERQVYDLRLKEKKDVCPVVNDLMRAFGADELKLTHFGPGEEEMTAALSVLSEDCSIVSDAMIKVLNYERTLRAYLALAAAVRPLPDGELRCAFANGERLLLSVRGGKSSVEKLPEDEAADLSLSELGATRLMFHHHTVLHSFGVEIPAAVRAWFPLPFYENLSDSV